MVNWSPASTAPCDAELHFPVNSEVRVRVPATSANLGCGFDCLGLAFDIWIDLHVCAADVWSIDEVRGIDTDKISTDVLENGIVKEFARTLYDRLNIKTACGGFRFVIDNQIPLGRGLGSSASSIISGISAAYLMAGYSLEDETVLEQIAQAATEIEGHPDNVMPAIFGGLQLCAGPVHIEIPFPSEYISCIIYIPKASVPTKNARDILPEVYPRESCVRNLSKAALLVASLSLKPGAVQNLQFALDDEMHEPYRYELCPAFAKIKKLSYTTEKMLGVYLSGAGPSTVILSHPGDEKEVIDLLLTHHPCLKDLGEFKNLSVIRNHSLAR